MKFTWERPFCGWALRLIQSNREVSKKPWKEKMIFNNVLNFAASYLKSQCEFNICRLWLLCVDGGGHAKTLSLDIAWGRLPRSHLGCWLCETEWICLLFFLPRLLSPSPLTFIWFCTFAVSLLHYVNVSKRCVLQSLPYSQEILFDPLAKRDVPWSCFSILTNPSSPSPLYNQFLDGDYVTIREPLTRSETSTAHQSINPHKVQGLRQQSQRAGSDEMSSLIVWAQERQERFRLRNCIALYAKMFWTGLQCQRRIN